MASVPAVPAVSFAPMAARRALAAVASAVVLLVALDRAVAQPLADAGPSQESVASGSHLLLSEVMTGGAGASDEFIELYNPTDAALPLEGLEVVYATASGATVSRKASWAAGATQVPPGAHVLIANEAGIFAAVADLTYASGLAAAGGSVALRIQGAASAVDAVGWGTAASAWLETRPAPAPAAGSSLERLPGGAAGSTQDTDDNLVDFVVQPVPDPRNSGSAPVPTATPTPLASDSVDPTVTSEPTPADTGSATPEPTPSDAPTTTASPSPTPAATPSPDPTPPPSPSPTPTPTPTPSPMTVGAARGLPDGSQVTVEGIALTDAAFTDGGGYLADATGGVAVLLTDGSFVRGSWLRATGTVDDRYAQRTIRSDAAGILVLGAAEGPPPIPMVTGAVGEALEGQLIQLGGTIASAQTQLSGAVAVELDDGSGPVRIVVGDATGIATGEWVRGASLSLVGVLGQRDASGTGTSGYRVQPRDAADILAFDPSATVTPTPSATPSPSPSASPRPSVAPTPTPAATTTPAPSAPLVSIVEARLAPTGTRLRVRGVVTLPSGLVDSGTAVLQDATGAILVRLGDEAGSVQLGQVVELDGVRSTKSGMLSLRTSRPPLVLGTQGDPEPMRSATGALGEEGEARLVVVRGAVSTAVTRSSAGSVSFSLDDGSGPIRVLVAAKAAIATGGMVRGAWVEVRGVLGQETTGREPDRGYRIWPRQSADLRVVAGAVPSVTVTSGAGEGDSESPSQLQVIPGSRFDALEGGAGAVDAWTGRAVVRPVLARAAPTHSPAPVTTELTEVVPARSRVARSAGLVVTGLGIGLLAGVVALLGRRTRRIRPAEVRAYTPADLTAHARSRELPPP